MLRRIALSAALAAGLLAAAPLSPASAAGFTVNSTADTPDVNLSDNVCATAANVCTLRAAIQQANASGGSDTISVPAMTIPLGSALTITSNLLLEGAGARQTVLGAVGGHGMLVVTAGTVTVKGITVTGATGGAGALGLSQSGGNLTLDGTRFVGNNASGVGATYGPVYTDGGVLLIRDSEISGNTTTSTSSGGWSGGLAAYAGTVRVENSTIAGNSVTGGTSAQGGGVWAGQNANVTIVSSTIAGNSASGNAFGAGVFQTSGGTGSIEIQDSVLADPKVVGNCGAGGGKTPIFLARNLVDDTSCGATSATRTVAAAGLGVLGDNGGQTNTRVPGAGSAAIDAAAACLSAADQRGRARPIGAACDLGAAEVGADLEIAAGVSNPAPTAGSDIVVTASSRNNGLDLSSGTTVTVRAAGARQILTATLGGTACGVVADTATCDAGVLASGATANVLLTVRMPDTGTVAVTAAVSGQLPDPVPGNNAAGASATVPGSATAACAVVRNGTPKADVLRGSAAGDRINGRAGNDRIFGKAGGDCLSGGPGKDRIVAGPGNDKVAVRDGARDRVNCGPGTDSVFADRKDKVSSTCEKVRRK